MFYNDYGYMEIKNFDKLARTSLREAALRIAEAGLQAIDTKAVIHKAVKIGGNTLHFQGEEVLLDGIGDITVIGVGKCALDAGEALEEILGDRLQGGVVVDVRSGAVTGKMKKIQGTHPLPSEQNVEAARTIVKLLEGRRKKDLVIFIISGGGSTFLCLPDERGCFEEMVVVKTLIRKGATIQEINTVRKHLSLARGGYLAKYAYPACVVSLIFSDVVGDDLGFIASGPTVKDQSTVKDAEAVLEKYDVLRTCGIEQCGLVETPKDNRYFERVNNILLVTNGTALNAMKARTNELGFQGRISTACLSGEASEAGLAIARDLHSVPSKTVLLYGGETTVTVRGEGRGGRNLELGLSALREIRAGELVVSVASDGRDNGEFAGAVCDSLTRKAVEENGTDIETVLKNNDEYPLFETVGNYIFTGDTGSNVSDLVIAMKE